MYATRAAAVPDAQLRLHVLLCLGADFDLAYIPHLCRYYGLAADSWNVVLHSNDAGEAGEHVTALARRAFESNLAKVSSKATLHTRVWLGEFNPYTKVDRLNDMVRELVPSGEWVMYVDADEFIESPHNGLKSLLVQCTTGLHKVMYGLMIDRFAPDKKPYPIYEDDDLFLKFPLKEEFTRTKLNASTEKPCLMLYEGEPLLANCHCYSGQTWQDYQRSGMPVLKVWHFKWIESTCEKLKYRVSSYKRQRLGWWNNSSRSLAAIYSDETRRDRNKPDPESSAKSHPYARLEERGFWKTGLSEAVLPEVWRPKWQLRPEDRVVTFGSCFARHLGPALRARRFTWWETEPPPQQLSPENAIRFGYNCFSCRTGSITTPTLLGQWIGWALGDEKPPEEYWLEGDRVIDPFRPSIEPGGFASLAEMLESRQQTLASMKSAILEADVFFFTLGMTESWVHDPSGWVYPACPGTAAGRFDPEHHRFVNLSFLQVQRALIDALERLGAVRPGLKVLLSVSPIPLTATATSAHVLAATSFSKSILRAVAGELAERPDVDYFPSYELVMAPTPLFGKQMFEANQRSVSTWAVDRVVDTFFAAHDVEPLAQSGPAPEQQDHPTASEDDCDDTWAEAFGE
jgi:hypothetical protein